MPFGRKARYVKAFQFGADGPLEGMEAILAQHRLRIEYYNALVEMELRGREARAALLSELAQESRLEEPKAVYERLKAAGKKKIREHPEYQAAREAQKALYEHPRWLALKDAQREERNALRREYGAKGLYSNNYLDVERAFDRARQSSELRFRRYSPHEGRLAVLYTEGLPMAKIGSDTRVQLPLPDPAIYRDRAIRRKHQRVLMKFRVRSVEGGKPLFVTVPVYLHRELPVYGICREVSLHWERVADRLRYSVSVVVEVGNAAPVAPRTGIGAVAVDLGWRKVEGGLRAGYWVGEDGSQGEILLSEGDVSQFLKCEDLQSIRDQHLNALRNGLAAWLKEPPAPLPEWVQEATATLAQWKSPARFAALYRRWQEERFHADEAGFGLLEGWHRRDRHLWQYQGNLREQMILRRREQYRVLAARLARQYDELVLEDFDLREVAELDQGAQDLPDAARHYRTIVAPSSLRSVLINAFQQRGKPVRRVNPAHTTTDCHVCGSPLRGDPATDQRLWCDRCEKHYDQDENAAYNLLSRAKGELATA